jgi:type IV secretion system protein VirB9
MLRTGSAVVRLWHDAFDLDGVPPLEGTTASGVRRILKADSTPPSQAASVREANHE